MVQQSRHLAQEIESMRRVEAAFTSLPDDKTRRRLAQWVHDNLCEPYLNGTDEAPAHEPG